MTTFRTLLTAVLLAGLTTSTLLAAGESDAELLKQAKISRAQAEQVALARVPKGKITSAEIENEHHALVWSFDIATSGTKDITEVLVNARTGKIVEITQESPSEQAKENAADAAKGRR